MLQEVPQVLVVLVQLMLQLRNLHLRSLVAVV